MNPALVVNAITAAIQLVQELSPVVAQLATSGQITVEQQNEIKAKVDALRSGDMFKKAEWQVE